MKAKILLLTFGLPILVGTICLAVLTPFDSTIDIIVGIAILLSVLIRIFFNQRKYISKFVISDSDLTINSLSPFLRNASDKFPFSSITDIEFTRANWIAEYPAELNIKLNGKWLTYLILEKELRYELQSKWAAANKSLPPA